MTFAPTIIYGDLPLTSAPYMVEEGFDLGSPDTTWAAAESMMRDGSLITSPGDANRMLRFAVLVEAGDSAQSPVDAYALQLELRKPFNTLTFIPGDGVGEAVKIDTFIGKSTYDYDQDLERMGLRRYILQIPALPSVQSVNQQSYSWTGPAKSTVTVTNPGGGSNRAATFVADNYLRLYKTAASASATSVVINGVAVPAGQVLNRVDASSNSVCWIPTHAYRGQTVSATWSSSTAPTGAHTVGYPYPNAGAPQGVGIIDALGSMRARCVITWTSPSGGCVLYTGPDPDFDLRERGVPEVMPSWNTSNEIIVSTESQNSPRQLNPDGIWPRLGLSGGLLATTTLAMPTSLGASVSIFNTTGVKTIVSASPRSPGGYRTDAYAHGDHMIHSPRAGFGLAGSTGANINATITWYDTWDHFPA